MKISKYRRGMKFAIVAAEVLLATLSAVCVGIVSCNAVINVRTNTMEINYYISPRRRYLRIRMCSMIWSMTI